MEDLYVLQTPGVPATFLQATHRPFQLLVYHLPPPPPGFLYAFTCSPTSFMLPPAIAPLTDDRNYATLPAPSTAIAYVSDRSLPSFPAPSTSPVSASTSNTVELHSAVSTSFSQHHFENNCASNAGEHLACCTPFWCTKEKGFPRPQSCMAEMKISAPQQEQSDSTLSTCAQKTPDEVIQENKRFNKTPSFRVKKIVRTNSQTNCVPKTIKTLKDSAVFSTCPLRQSLPDHKPVQHRVRSDQHWRARTKPREIQEHENKADVNCSDAGGEVCNGNVGELNKLMGSFSFGLNS